jgi:ATP-dependent Lon protease
MILEEAGLGGAVEKGEGAKGVEMPEELPILPIREAVLYPRMLLPLMVTQERMIKLIDAALLSNKMIGIVAIEHKEVEEVKPEHLFPIGCAASILKMLKMPNNSLRLLIQGTSRIALGEFTQLEPYIRAKVTPLKDQGEKTTDIEAVMVGVKGIFQSSLPSAAPTPMMLLCGTSCLGMYGFRRAFMSSGRRSVRE